MPLGHKRCLGRISAAGTDGARWAASNGESEASGGITGIVALGCCRPPAPAVLRSGSSSRREGCDLRLLLPSRQDGRCSTVKRSRLPRSRNSVTPPPGTGTGQPHRPAGGRYCTQAIGTPLEARHWQSLAGGVRRRPPRQRSYHQSGASPIDEQGRQDSGPSDTDAPATCPPEFAPPSSSRNSPLECLLH